MSTLTLFRGTNKLNNSYTMRLFRMIKYCIFTSNKKMVSLDVVSCHFSNSFRRTSQLSLPFAAILSKVNMTSLSPAQESSIPMICWFHSRWRWPSFPRKMFREFRGPYSRGRALSRGKGVTVRGQKPGTHH